MTLHRNTVAGVLKKVGFTQGVVRRTGLLTSVDEGFSARGGVAAPVEVEHLVEYTVYRDEMDQRWTRQHEMTARYAEALRAAGYDVEARESGSAHLLYVRRKDEAR